MREAWSSVRVHCVDGVQPGRDLAPLSAMAESPDVSAGQEVAGSQDQAPQSLGMKISWPSIIIARPRGTGGQGG
jgi:hypothetical protein